MAHDLVLLSPEKTVLSFRLASLGLRASAHLLDFLLLLLAFIAITLISALLSQVASPLATSLMLASMILGPFAYFIVLEGFWNGQTVGKRVMRLRVRKLDGTPVTFGAALTRNLLRPADFLPALYFAGLLAIFTNIRSQRLGDLVAGTVVISEREPPAQVPPSPHRVNIHPFETHVGDLRYMTPEEYAALKQLCDRFPNLSPTVREPLLELIWTPFASRHGISSLPQVHNLYLAEAAVMRYGRDHGLL